MIDDVSFFKCLYVVIDSVLDFGVEDFYLFFIWVFFIDKFDGVILYIVWY